MFGVATVHIIKSFGQTFCSYMNNSADKNEMTSSEVFRENELLKIRLLQFLRDKGKTCKVDHTDFITLPLIYFQLGHPKPPSSQDS